MNEYIPEEYIPDDDNIDITLLHDLYRKMSQEEKESWDLPAAELLAYDMYQDDLENGLKPAEYDPAYIYEIIQMFIGFDAEDEND